MTKSLLPVLAVAALAPLIAPADAAAQARDRTVTRIVVFGDDPCPRSTDDNVVVCARKPDSERYRIPEELRETGSRQESQSWAVNARYLETVNETGIQQCSPVGPAGQLGCLEKLIERSGEERVEIDEELVVPE
ncbi:hypothetical protein [Sphingomicrobium astaxanthinifaciens]|uniref:hypothetical protein n=1 Tax=Sphingomicrobium astaxanthinifaciens TaxID=1227949 RepID=UPI001FCC079B|nr:hypothetical protein [Sphingomicrobium astaxanthinifaciens]MCJ7421522.1 hypothetical protein [Sphingomicrobium astaxanthinifaciens]